MASPVTVALTGASGLLGGNLAALLRADRHTVRALRRSPASVAHLADLDVTWVDGDLDDAASLRTLCAGAEALFHCAAAVGVQNTVTPALQRTNVDGTANVIDAVRAAGVRRLVHCSSVVAIGLPTNGALMDETLPWNFPDAKLDDGYTVTKHRAEELVMAAVNTGLDAVVVNPGFMIGPRDRRPSSGRMVRDIARKSLLARLHTPGVNSFVDVRDVARGMIAAWQRGRVGERYILAGHNMTYGAFFAMTARVVNAPPPVFAVPRVLGALIGWIGDAQAALGSAEPLASSCMVRWSFETRYGQSSAKAQRELGYVISPLEPAIADALAWFRAHGMV